MVELAATIFVVCFFGVVAIAFWWLWLILIGLAIAGALVASVVFYPWEALQILLVALACAALPAAVFGVCWCGDQAYGWWRRRRQLDSIRQRVHAHRRGP